MFVVVSAASAIGIAQEREPHFRRWKTKDEQHKTQAKLVKVLSNAVLIQKYDGTQIEVPLKTLHRDDLIYLVGLAEFRLPQSELATNGHSDDAGTAENESSEAAEANKKATELPDFADKFMKRMERKYGELQLLTSAQKVRVREDLIEQLQEIGEFRLKAKVLNVNQRSGISLLSNSELDNAFCSVVFATIEKEGRVYSNAPALRVKDDDLEQVVQLSKGDEVIARFDMLGYGFDKSVAERYTQIDDISVAEVRVINKNSRGRAGDFELTVFLFFEKIGVRRANTGSRKRRS